MDSMAFNVRAVQIGLMASVGLGWVALQRSGRTSETAWERILPSILAAYSLLQIGFIAYLWLNHAAFPLNLEAMELTVLAHVRRVLAGLPIYVPPSAEFAPLAYNPLFYVLSVPFTWIAGPSLLALRLSAIVGALGCAGILFLALRRETGSRWWALVGVGLFAAAYRAMDTYLDNAHADSWMLFTALLGCYLVSLNRSRALNLAGVVCAVASFWFKQPGAAFAVGIVAYLMVRDGIRRSWPYWSLALVLGPVLYLLIPEQWTGSLFAYYTWAVPRQWVSISPDMLRRLVGYFVRDFPLLAVASGVGWLAGLRKGVVGGSPWFFLLPFAFLTAVSGAMDSESNNNVFIPLGVWLILTGVIALSKAAEARSGVGRRGLPQAIVGASFVLLVYNPWSVIVSPRAVGAYADMQSYLRELDGPVYAPWIGPLADGYVFSPGIHWVPMTDLVRRPGQDLTSDPLIRTLLEPMVHPAGRAYILTNIPLDQDSALSFLGDTYFLAEDLGTRFAALSALPKRYSLGWPRYLYAYRVG